MNNLNRKITIKDVAKRAQVSIATVSNTLNNAEIVKPETREKVVRAAQELGYIPNLMGRQLRSGETKMLGIFTDSISGPYFNTLIGAIANEVDRLGYGMHVIVTNSHNAVMDSVLGGIVDGAIMFDHRIGQMDITQIKNHGLPTVLIDRVDSGKKMSSITFDSMKMGHDATKYLLNLGHKRIGYVDGFSNNYDSNMRKAGFRQAINEAGLDINDMPILHGMYEEEIAYNAVKMYLYQTKGQLVTAFIASNDQMALGIIKAIQSSGYQVPDDFSVIGFDDIELAQYFRPSLTTVRNSIERQGVMAVHELIDMIHGVDGGKKEILPGKLIIRESTSIAKSD